MHRSADNKGIKIKGGQQNSRQGSGRFLKLTIFLALAVMLLFWLEWLGSEREMEMIEESVPLPGQLES